MPLVMVNDSRVTSAGSIRSADRTASAVSSKNEHRGRIAGAVSGWAGKAAQGCRGIPLDVCCRRDNRMIPDMNREFFGGLVEEF